MPLHQPERLYRCSLFRPHPTPPKISKWPAKPSPPSPLWHLLSLDAPTVAALWTWFIAATNHIHLPLSSPLAMFIAVWTLYAADRVLDAQSPNEADPRSPPPLPPSPPQGLPHRNPSQLHRPRHPSSPPLARIHPSLPHPRRSRLRILHPHPRHPERTPAPQRDRRRHLLRRRHLHPHSRPSARPPAPAPSSGSPLRSPLQPQLPLHLRLGARSSPPCQTPSPRHHPSRPASPVTTRPHPRSRQYRTCPPGPPRPLADPRRHRPLRHRSAPPPSTPPPHPPHHPQSHRRPGPPHPPPPAAYPQMKTQPNFNPIARPYRWLEYLTLGRALERSPPPLPPHPHSGKDEPSSSATETAASSPPSSPKTQPSTPTP